MNLYENYPARIPKRDRDFLKDLSIMFQHIADSISDLEKNGEELDKNTKFGLSFIGFDLNDSRESSLWESVRSSNGLLLDLRVPVAAGAMDGNSHWPVFDVYSRMIQEYNAILSERKSMDEVFQESSLTREELCRIKDAGWPTPATDDLR